jgi:hypothetical protein
MEQSAREADKSPSSQGITHTLYNSKINWKSQLLVPIQRQTKPVLTLTAYFINMHLSTILPSRSKSSK